MHPRGALLANRTPAVTRQAGAGHARECARVSAEMQTQRILRVQVHHQDRGHPQAVQGRGQVRGQGGFAHAALGRNNGNHLHGWPLRGCQAAAGRGCGSPARRANTDGRSAGRGACGAAGSSRWACPADPRRPAKPVRGERDASAGEGSRGVAAWAGAITGEGIGAGSGSAAGTGSGAGRSLTGCAQPAGAGTLAAGAGGLCGTGVVKPPGRRSTEGTSAATAPRTADNSGQRSLERWCSCLRASSW